MNQHLFYDLFDKVQDLKNPLKADALFEAAREIYGARHLLYTRLNSPAPTHGTCHIQGTYSDAWLQHYFANDYLSIDPVATHGIRALQSFDWSDLPRESQNVKQIFHEANEFGLGNQGFTIPMVSYSGERAIFNINAEHTDKEWADRKPLLMRDLTIISQFFHQSVAAEMIGQSTPPPPCLSDRELECLKWAASGKTIWETSVILSLSERTVRFHLDQARRKLDCTTKIHAVAKAVATGLINIS